MVYREKKMEEIIFQKGTKNGLSDYGKGGLARKLKDTMVKRLKTRDKEEGKDKSSCNIAHQFRFSQKTSSTAMSSSRSDISSNVVSLY